MRINTLDFNSLVILSFFNRLVLEAVSRTNHDVVLMVFTLLFDTCGRLSFVFISLFVARS